MLHISEYDFYRLVVSQGERFHRKYPYRVKERYHGYFFNYYLVFEHRLASMAIKELLKKTRPSLEGQTCLSIEMEEVILKGLHHKKRRRRRQLRVEDVAREITE